jgi:hypothetical protein
VHLERAVVESGKLVALRGTIEAERGSVSPSLWSAAQDHLGLTAPAGELPPDASRLIAFRQLALGFELDGQFLRLSGGVNQPHGGPLLEVPPEHAVPAVNLLRALVPDNLVQVPATRQTDALVGLLPVPDLAPARTATGAHTPARLRSGGPADETPALRQPGLR